MLLVSKLTLVVVLSLTTIVVSTNQIVSGTCGCPMERLDSFHEERIPAWITEWICYQPGASCGTGIERAPVSSVSIHSFLSNVHACIFIGLNTVSATHWTTRGWIHKEDWGCGKSGAQTEHYGEHWMSLHACWHAKFPANWVNFKPLNDVILSNIGHDNSFRYCFIKHCNARGRWFGTQPNPIHYSLLKLEIH